MSLTIIRANVRELVSRKEAADILNVQPQTLAKWGSTQRYDLPYIKVGKAVRYRRTDLQKFMERHTVGAVHEH
jgi:excisionase family DNA binding protein